jgi:large subunit ribosomal protein L17
MRHRNRGRKLGMNPAHRKAMVKNMIKSLVDNERIVTTVPKAKFIQPLAERIIHLSKVKTLHNIRRIEKLIGDKALQIEFLDDDGNPKADAPESVLQKLFNDIGPRNRDRNGGYTRIIRLVKRRLGDGGERCFIELVEGGPTEVLSNAPEAPESSQATAGV